MGRLLGDPPFLLFRHFWPPCPAAARISSRPPNIIAAQHLRPAKNGFYVSSSCWHIGPARTDTAPAWQN